MLKYLGCLQRGQRITNFSDWKDDAHVLNVETNNLLENLEKLENV